MPEEIKSDIPLAEPAKEGVEPVVDNKETEPQAPVEAPEQKIEAPEYRKSAKDFIIERKQKKIDKLEAENLEKPVIKPKEGEEIPESEPTTPDFREFIRQEVAKTNKPFEKSLRTQRDDQELQDLNIKHPNSKEIEKDIRTYMNHPAFKKVPIEFIYFGLAGKQGILQKASEAADQEAEGASLGGNPRRPWQASSVPDIASMNDKDYDDFLSKVKRGQIT